MSILSTLPVFVLSNSLALNDLIRGLSKLSPGDRVDGDAEAWRMWAYTTSHLRDSSRPDHIFNFRWDKFQERNYVDLTEALECVGDVYLEIQNHRLYVRKNAVFYRWQNLRTRMTTLPIKIRFLQKHRMWPNGELAHPYSPSLEDFIREDGLNETHLHINGYLFPEESWLYDLYAISEFTEQEERQYRSDRRIREFYQTVNPELTPKLLAGRLKLATMLRDNILCMLDETTEQIRERYRILRRYLHRFSLTPDFFCAPTREHRIPRNYAERMQQEMDMWYRAFLRMQDDEFYRDILGQLLHLYILLENEYIQLYRHNERDFGFEAFAKASDHWRRAIGSNAYYKTAFLRLLKATEPTPQTQLEIRLTPDALIKNGEKLLRLWKESCKEFASIAKKQGKGSTPLTPNLILVAHFIKRKPIDRSKSKGPLLSYLYDQERTEHLHKAGLLADFCMRFLQNYPVPIGIDAASSELVLPPEVFAPAYRYFERRTHISHKTYHCGEDFHHLLSGIRAVYEAITFLNMGVGSRIGHGTAIGIAPDIWLDTIPKKLIIPRGEWLLDLIFAARFLPTERLVDIRQETLNIAHQIFGSKHTKAQTLHELDTFFDARSFIPRFVSHIYDKDNGRAAGLSCISNSEEEYEAIRQFINQRGSAWIPLFLLWFTDKDVRRRMTETIEVPANFPDSRHLLLLQQRVQKLVAEKDIVIESPPVSNLRISQYKLLPQHHLLRWLGVPGHTFEGDVHMNICMGSDDPGIFVTDIKNEYYHLYNMLREAHLSPQESIDKLRELNRNGRIYAFRTLPPPPEPWMPNYK